MASVDASQKTHSFAAIKNGKSARVSLNVQFSAEEGPVKLQVDRKVAAKLIEAQRRMTDEGGNRVVGGTGITKNELAKIFTSTRDAGGNNGRPRYVTGNGGEAALRKLLDTARDDRFAVRLNGQSLELTGFSGKTTGAEGEFVKMTKALKTDIAMHNLFGTPVPSKA